MKKTMRVLSLFCSLTIVGQLAFAQFKMSDSRMESDESKVIGTLLISFVVGNIVAWSMGAYPQEFKLKPYSAGEAETIRDLEMEMSENPDEPEIKTELGTLYFQHNDLDKAEVILERAVEQSPDDGELLAIYSANEAKQAGAMWDFSWGILKLNRLGNAVDGLNRAIELAPDNFMVRLYRMNTLIGLKNRKGSFSRIFEDEQWFQSRVEQDPELFPDGVRLYFYKVLAEAWTVRSGMIDTEKQRSVARKQASRYEQLVLGLNQEKQTTAGNR